MTAKTAKAIKNVVEALKNYYVCTGGTVTACWPAEKELEQALHDFAESVTLSAIEP